MKDMIKSLEAQLQSSNTSLSTAIAEVSRHRSSANQLQALLDSAEKSRHTELQDMKKQVSVVSEANSKIGKCYVAVLFCVVRDSL